MGIGQNRNQFEEVSFPTKVKVEIVVNGKQAKVDIKNINLEDGGREILGLLTIRAEKAPLEIEEQGTISVVNFSVEDENTKGLVQKSAELSKITDERERIDALLKLLKTHVTYAYNNVIEEKAREEGISKKDLDKLRDGVSTVSFSEVLKHGVGVCGHLSAIYLYLASKAKLKGIVVNSDPLDTPINIIRTDNNEKLFKSYDVGVTTEHHAWVEIQLEDGTWIPVDPSTEITGTTEEGMVMFKSAGYKAYLSGLIDVESLKGSDFGSLGSDKHKGVALPGEKEFVFDQKMGLKRNISSNKKRRIENGHATINITPSNILGGGRILDINFEEIVN